MKLLFALITILSTLSCATTKPSSRKPAQQDTMPQVHSEATPLYSWTNNTAVIQNPQDYLEKEFAWVRDCNAKIAKNPEAEIQGCEGNGLATGPGLYTCDNPFTSHDYGSAVLITVPQAGHTNIGNGTGLPPAGTVDRALTGNAALDAIIYDFRANDFSARALVVRGPGILDLSQTHVIPMQIKDWKSFDQHPAFACTPATRLEEILQHWGDQMEFLSFTFDTFNASEQNGFANNGHLNNDGMIALIAGDLSAMSDDVLKARVAALVKKFPGLSDSMKTESCQETDSEVLRKCYFQRLYRSVVGDMGSPNHPTYAWKYKLTIQVLQELKVIAATDLKYLGDNPKLFRFLATKTAKDSNRVARATEAYQCMSVVHDRLAKSNLGMWAAE